MASSWPRIVLHADMDAFYAAIEQLDDPGLRGKPVLVGPPGGRGVVLTASYEARPFGVGSAMPMAVARRQCPAAIVVPPRFERYQEASRQIMSTFADFSPDVEALSLDEAFLEMTGSEHFFGDPTEMGRRVKKAVKEATGLTVSVGASGTKYVAKVASAHQKPDGLTVVPQDEAKSFLDPLPISRLWGVGPKTEERLHELGIRTIGQIAAADPDFLLRRLGRAGPHFFQLAHARDPRRVTRGRKARSIGSERTLAKDIQDREEIELHLLRAADTIARRLRRKDLVTRGVRVKLKTASFESTSRQRRLPEPTDVAEVLFEAAASLLDMFDFGEAFRLVGMAAFDLAGKGDPVQLDLFASSVRRRQLESTMDRLAERFGSTVVKRGSDLENPMGLSPNLDFLDETDPG